MSQHDTSRSQQAAVEQIATLPSGQYLDYTSNSQHTHAHQADLEGGSSKRLREAVADIVRRSAIQKLQLSARHVIAREVVNHVDVLYPLPLLAVIAQGQGRFVVTEHSQRAWQRKVVREPRQLV